MSRAINEAMMRTAVLLTGVLTLPSGGAWGADAYQQRVLPFVARYCVSCHDGQRARGELDLAGYNSSEGVVRDFRRWTHVIEFIRGAEMPPADAPLQPGPDERAAVVEALEEMLLEAAERSAGDPGRVPPRRLSNSELNYSVHDLTGVDIRPARDFPADPAGGEGFDNTGEALSMSPSLLQKHLGAAREVSQHLVLTPEGVVFAPFPITSYNERKKLTEQAVIDFYQQHDVQLLDYLTAAWRYRHRTAQDKALSIEQWADRRQLSGKYLEAVWSLLESARVGPGLLGRVGAKWEAVPPPADRTTDQAADKSLPRELRELHAMVEFCRSSLGYERQGLIRSNAGNWPIGHLDFRARVAANRDQCDTSRLAPERLLRFERIPKPKQDEPGGATLRVQVEPLTSDSRGSRLRIVRPLVSKSNTLPRNEDEEAKHQAVTLRSLLQRHDPEQLRRLDFVRSGGESNDHDTLLVPSGAVLEIELNAAMLREIDGRHLLLSCAIESPPAGGALVVRQAVDRELPDSWSQDSELLVSAEGRIREELEQAGSRLCAVFPNRFVYVDDKRGLAAGFHLVEGLFRDDRPLVKLVLDESQARELDRLWEELHFVTRHAETLLRGFVWFERSERHVLHDSRFDFLRPEDPKLVEPELLARFERLYLEKLGVQLEEPAGEEAELRPRRDDDRFAMIHGFFEDIRRGLRRQDELLAQAEPRAVAEIERLAERAFRRPLESDHRAALGRLYDRLRRQGQGIEESLRGVTTAVLMSPEFLYRYGDPSPADAHPSSDQTAPLSDRALASRLSYWLWSSLPDEQLLEAAAAGKLSEESELLGHTRRMVKDPKVERLAIEFFGQWLRYRDYLNRDPLNGEAFPSYTPELRAAMFQEPAHLATDLIRNDRPITELISADHTFVNRVLAKHYGGAIAQQYDRRRGGQERRAGDPWIRVEGLHAAGRGGLLGMGVILSSNSRGERTSPVRRGFWTVHHLLGQHFPPPPADVPELPSDEQQAAATIRELLAAHTSDAKCAMCHKHFDGLGLALEGFDPIGRARSRDRAGRAIDNAAALPDGRTVRGAAELAQYLQQQRRDDFVRTFCRKFLGYALGRSVVLSDRPLLQRMELALENNDYRFSAALETVVLSRQFREMRTTGGRK